MTKLLILISSSFLATILLQAAPFSYTSKQHFYFQTYAGIASMTKTDGSDPSNPGLAQYDANRGVQLVGAIGRYFDSLRLELEYSFRNMEMEGIGFTTVSPINGNMNMNSAMLNLLYEAPIGDMMFVYMGGGVGVSLIKFELGQNNKRDTSFALQLITGVGYKMTDKLSVLLGYRYFRTLDTKYDMRDANDVMRTVSIGRQAIHSFEAGLRFDF